MATSNFANRNASSIFAVLTTKKDDETGEYYYPDMHDYDNLIDCLQYNMQQEFGELFADSNSVEDNCNRSYEGTVFGGISKYFAVDNAEIEVSIQLVIRNGYYDGANLDWYMYDNYSGRVIEDFDEIDEIVTEAFDYSDLNKGLISIHKPRIENEVIEWFENVIEQTEKIYKQFAEYNLRVKARFSNGETWYEEVG